MTPVRPVRSGRVAGGTASGNARDCRKLNPHQGAIMERLPSIFISHGAPTYALEPGLAGSQLNALGRMLPKPRAVLVVSPHWMTREAQVTGAARPRTIHDFGGFDPALHEMNYPADGNPAFAARAADLLRSGGWPASVNPERGLDHGAWVPLMHLYPDHDVPVIQASMPSDLDAQAAFNYGRGLGQLGKEGVLVVGSGSLTHNLFEFRQGSESQAEYAREFTAWIRDAVEEGDEGKLLAALERAPHAARAHPTTEHFLPLLVALGAAPSVLPATVVPGGIVHGVLSMESYVFGTKVELNVELETDSHHA